jgi:hypothetical protein
MPDTLAYLLLGLAATTVIMGAFIASLFTRRRSLEADLKLLERLQEE